MKTKKIFVPLHVAADKIRKMPSWFVCEYKLRFYDSYDFITKPLKLKGKVYDLGELNMVISKTRQ